MKALLYILVAAGLIILAFGFLVWELVNKIGDMALELGNE